MSVTDQAREVIARYVGYGASLTEQQADGLLVILNGAGFSIVSGLYGRNGKIEPEYGHYEFVPDEPPEAEVRPA